MVVQPCGSDTQWESGISFVDFCRQADFLSGTKIWHVDKKQLFFQQSTDAVRNRSRETRPLRQR